MKNILLVIALLFVIDAHADIEYSSTEESKVTIQEITSNRACWEEVSTLGCGAPGEDPIHFRACLKNVHPTLSSNCKKMMTSLYGIK